MLDLERLGIRGSPPGYSSGRTQRPSLLWPTYLVLLLPACSWGSAAGVPRPNTGWQLRPGLPAPRSKIATDQTSSTPCCSQPLWPGLSGLSISLVLPDHRCCWTSESQMRRVLPLFFPSDLLMLLKLVFLIDGELILGGISSCCRLFIAHF